MEQFLKNIKQNLPANGVSQLVEISNLMSYPIDQKMLAACMQKASEYMVDHTQSLYVRIVINERVPHDAPAYKHPGWLEYMMLCEWDGLMLEVHAIQRKPGMVIEFCS